MPTKTLEKNYKELKSRLESLEKLVAVLVNDEIKTEKILQWKKASRDIDRGLGKRITSQKELVRYFKSL